MHNLVITTKEDLENLIQASVRKVLSEQPKQELVQQDAEDKFLNIKEASQFLSLAEQTIYGYTSKGLIPFIKRAKRVLFLRSDLENWLMQGRKMSVEELKVQLIKEGKI